MDMNTDATHGTYTRFSDTTSAGGRIIGPSGVDRRGRAIIDIADNNASAAAGISLQSPPPAANETISLAACGRGNLTASRDSYCSTGVLADNIDGGPTTVVTTA